MPKLVAFLLVAGLATPAIAQGADQDVRCVLVSNTFAKIEKDETKRRLAGESALFYLGRIDGRFPPAQLKAQMLAQGRTLTAANLGPTMNACAKRLQQSVTGFQAIGRQLAPPPPPPKAK